MGLFRKLFGRSKEPGKPDDYYRGSSIASTIDAFVSSQGLGSLINDDWSVVLGRDYDISLSRMGAREDARALVRLNDLESMSDFKRIQTDNIMGNSPLGYMATDRLALDVLRKIKEQIC